MAIVPGEYVFSCGECNGDGQVEIGDQNHDGHEWVQCDRCFGDGVLRVDEDEAAEMIEAGATPDRAPAGYSEPW